MHELGRISLKS